MNPRTKVVNTAATTPAEFLSGAPAPTLPPEEAVAAASRPVAEVPVTAAAPQVDPPVPMAVIRNQMDKEEAAKDAPDPAEPDPFVQLWKRADGNASISAWEIPGGCVVRRASNNGTQVSSALCFVPGVKVEGGKLVAI